MVNRVPSDDRVLNGDRVPNGDRMPNGDRVLHGDQVPNCDWVLNGERLPNRDRLVTAEPLPDEIGERLGRRAIEVGMPVAGLQQEVVTRDAKTGTERL